MSITAGVAVLTVVSVALVLHLVATAWAVVTLRPRALARAGIGAAVLLLIDLSIAAYIGATASLTELGVV